MKKIIFILSIPLFFTQFLFAQKFEFNRVFYESSKSIVKIKGDILINDSLIVINTNGTKSEITVVKQTDSPDYKQYKAIFPDNSDYEVRITFSKSAISKSESHNLIYELKDNFSGNISKLIYYLILKE